VAVAVVSADYILQRFVAETHYVLWLAGGIARAGVTDHEGDSDRSRYECFHGRHPECVLPLDVQRRLLLRS
jgi:hypothetical protein